MEGTWLTESARGDADADDAEPGNVERAGELGADAVNVIALTLAMAEPSMNFAVDGRGNFGEGRDGRRGDVLEETGAGGPLAAEARREEGGVDEKAGLLGSGAAREPVARGARRRGLAAPWGRELEESRVREWERGRGRERGRNVDGPGSTGREAQLTGDGTVLALGLVLGRCSRDGRGTYGVTGGIRGRGRGVGDATGVGVIDDDDDDASGAGPIVAARARGTTGSGRGCPACVSACGGLGRLGRLPMSRRPIDGRRCCARLRLTWRGRWGARRTVSAGGGCKMAICAKSSVGEVSGGTESSVLWRFFAKRLRPRWRAPSEESSVSSWRSGSGNPETDSAIVVVDKEQGRPINSQSLKH